MPAPVPNRVGLAEVQHQRDGDGRLVGCGRKHAHHPPIHDGVVVQQKDRVAPVAKGTLHPHVVGAAEADVLAERDDLGLGATRLDGLAASVGGIVVDDVDLQRRKIAAPQAFDALARVVGGAIVD